MKNAKFSEVKIINILSLQNQGTTVNTEEILDYGEALKY